MLNSELGLFGRLGRWWVSLSLAAQLWTGALAALALWLLWAVVLVRVFLWGWTGKFTPKDLSELGQIGDLFGGVNALFAAFAFVGVAIAAYYQHSTFKLQVEQDVRQSFEPLFFKLLDRHMSPGALLCRFTQADANNGEVPLGACMTDARRNLMGAMVGSAEQGDLKADSEKVASLYAHFYFNNDGVLAPYFRNLYHLFKFIAFSDLPKDEKVRYANIARAGLNKDELLLLAMNGASPDGAEFRPLVEGFGLLKHLWGTSGTTEMTPDRVIAQTYYEVTATMSLSEREAYWAKHPELRPRWLM